MVKHCFCWKQAEKGTPVVKADCSCSKGCRFCHPQPPEPVQPSAAPVVPVVDESSKEASL
jgi:hypothetical protein